MSTTESFWLQGYPIEARPALTADIATDVAVVGAGITGLLTALGLAERGHSVVVIEARRIASGTTGSTTGKVTAQHGLTYAGVERSFGREGARLYADAATFGIERIAALVETHHIECGFERGPAVLYALTQAGADRIGKEAAAARHAGLHPRTGDPNLPFPTTGSMWFDDQAMFHAAAFCRGVADAFEKAGGRIFEHTPARGVDHGEPCVVRTDLGSVRAHRIVLATQIPIVADGLFFARAHPYRSYALALDVEGPVPQEMYLSVDEPIRSLRPIHWGGEELLLVGGESHRTGQGEPETIHYASLEHWARTHFRVRKVRARWSAHDFVPIDGVPYIGPATNSRSEILVATGFKKWGMTTAAVAAEILTRQIADDSRHPWADVFDSTRAKPLASARRAIGENVNVSVHLVGDRVRTLSSPSVDELERGTGGICSAGGKRVACFRDEDGLVHAVSATCTHLGCVVRFNDAERTWDCPCHGSRFALDGSVINGPATTGLDRVDLDEATGGEAT